MVFAVMLDKPIIHIGGKSYKDTEVDLTPYTWIVLQVSPSTNDLDSLIGPTPCY